MAQCHMQQNKSEYALFYLQEMLLYTFLNKDIKSEIKLKNDLHRFNLGDLSILKRGRDFASVSGHRPLTLPIKTVENVQGTFMQTVRNRVNGCKVERMGTFESKRINSLERIEENVHALKTKESLYLLVTYIASSFV